MKWISVKDRLPDEYDVVLAFGHDFITSMVCRYVNTTWQVWPLACHRKASNVTHWMPLPEPPEAKVCGCPLLKEKYNGNT